MGTQIKDADDVSFPTDESALASIYLAQEGRTQHICARAQDAFQLVGRCHFIAGSEVSLTHAAFLEGPPLPEGTATFLLPRFGAKLSAEEIRALPKDIDWRKTVKSDEAEIRRSLDTNFGPHVVLVPSGFLFTSGSYEQLRRFLLEHAGLHTVVDLPSGVLQLSLIHI